MSHEKRDLTNCTGKEKPYIVWRLRSGNTMWMGDFFNIFSVILTMQKALRTWE